MTPLGPPGLPTTYGFSLSWMFLASFAMIVIGMILMVIASFTLGGGIPSVGGIILIGPIPIILGGGPESIWLILLGAVITVIALVTFLLVRRRIHG